MLRPNGCITVTDPDKPTEQIDTYCCAHCGRHTQLAPKQRPEDCGGWCRMCAKPVCNKKECNDRCVPLERQLLIMEGSREARRSYGFP